MKVKNINIKIFEELRVLKPEIYENCKQKFPNFQKWVNGEDFPTYNQLVELSKIFNIPFGYFFLEKLPKYDLPIPHYRTIKENDFTPSDELLDTIKFAQKIQEWAKIYSIRMGTRKYQILW